ncbi:MAG: hypothetical protein MK135_16285 [Polyangiaceae bacterium]|nr:hypothetical protein [Polyangiaceae bacterium]
MTYSFSQAHRYLAFMTKSGEHSWQSFSLVCGIFLMAMCFGGCGGRAERPELVVEGPGGVTFVEPPLPVEENIVLPAPVEPEPTPVVEPTDYEEEDCPDEEPPEPITECDALAAESGCPAGEGCFPFLIYPFGEGCGFATYGAECIPTGMAVQGEFCDDSLTGCAAGHICVVGAIGGARCAELCALAGVNGCAAGLICSELDIPGYGVCF